MADFDNDDADLFGLSKGKDFGKNRPESSNSNFDVKVKDMMHKDEGRSGGIAHLLSNCVAGAHHLLNYQRWVDPQTFTRAVANLAFWSGLFPTCSSSALVP